MKILIHGRNFMAYSSELALHISNESLGNDVGLVVDETFISQKQLTNKKEVGGWIQLIHSIEKRGVNLHRILGNRLSPVANYKIYKEFRSYKNDSYDVLHLQTTNDPRFILLAIKIPMVLTLHEVCERKGNEYSGNVLKKCVVNFTSYIMRKNSNAIIVHTKSCFELLSSKEKEKAFLIPHGVRTNYVKEASKKEKNILFFGRADVYKGIDLLISAMSEVWRFDPNVSLQILASNGNYTFPSVIDSRISVTSSGYSEEELDSAILNSYVICIPYRNVSGSGVADRAFGSGRPVVVSDLVGLRELVDDVDLRFVPGDVSDLGRALIAALRKEPKVNVVKASRTWENVAKLHQILYENVVKPK